MDENRFPEAYKAKEDADRAALHTRDMILPATVAGVVACIILILVVLRWAGV